ncbi:MAG TPA: zinc-ribbon domain containing protein [Ktedonobacteraceae bacterium]
MTSYEGYQDRILTCRDCGQEFTFTAGEQEFFATKGLTNAPSRCPDCRKARRNSGGGSSSPRPRGEQHEAICANCGNPTTVPFIPREDRPVYCSDCFQEQRASRPARGGYTNSSSSSYSSGSGGSSGGSSGYGNSSSSGGGGGYGGSSGRGGGRSGGGGGRDRDRRDRGDRERW